MIRTLKDRLADWAGAEGWVDADLAAYQLGATVGVVPEWPAGKAWASEYKGIFWSANPLGDALYRMLQSLVGAGVLENNGEGAYRWNPAWHLGPK